MIYKGITSLRNYLFEVGILKEYLPEVLSIGVGNLTVGGTGKTPMVNYLISILKERNIGVISRGYGRKSEGFLVVDDTSSAELVGDETFMLSQKNLNAHFFVSESRVLGYKNAHDLYPEIDCFIFDDVYQHRYLKPDINILLCDYNRPFYTDHVLPFGRLRESRNGANRADIIIVSKTPNSLPYEEKELIINEIRKYAKLETPILFAEYAVQTPLNKYRNQLPEGSSVILISALANNTIFYKQQAENYEVLEHFEFRDHFAIPEQKIREILNKNPETPIITTEKDMVKIKPFLSIVEENRFFIPEVVVKMDNSLINYLSNHPKFA
jgi:tetraacyldisaccharide 4'-kinase